MENIMPNKRPGIITAVCVVGFLGAISIAPLIFSDISRSIGAWRLPSLYLAFYGIIPLICMVGLWKMKKWSVIAYTTFVGINQILYVSMGIWHIYYLIIPAIVITIGFSKYKLME